MAVAGTIGVEQPITLATTVTLVTGVGAARKLLILESDQDVYLVTLKGTADGGALPSTGRLLFDAAILPVEVDIAGYGLIGFAGALAGTARVEFRL